MCFRSLITASRTAIHGGGRHQSGGPSKYSKCLSFPSQLSRLQDARDKTNAIICKKIGIDHDLISSSYKAPTKPPS